MIRLDSSTFITAIAAAASTVPGNSSVPGAAPRSTSPAASAMSAAISTRSSPSHLLSDAAKPETTPKQMTGVAASTEIAAADRCRLPASSGKTGGRLVIAPRRLNPSAATPTISSACSSGRACSDVPAFSDAVDRNQVTSI